MFEGQSYIGDTTPLWIVVYKDGSEVKFSIN